MMLYLTMKSMSKLKIELKKKMHTLKRQESCAAVERLSGVVSKQWTKHLAVELSLCLLQHQ